MQKIWSGAISAKSEAMLLIIHDSGVLLLRSVVSGHETVAELTGDIRTREGMHDLLIAITNLKSYQVQPITILLATKNQYTYVRSFSGNVTLPLLQDTGYVTLQAMSRAPSAKTIVLQGIERDWLSLLRCEVRATGLPVVKIMTLAGHAIISGRARLAKENGASRTIYCPSCEIQFVTTAIGSVTHRVFIGRVSGENDFALSLHGLFGDFQIGNDPNEVADRVANIGSASHTPTRVASVTATAGMIVWHGQTGWITTKVPWLTVMSSTGSHLRRIAILLVPLAITFWGLEMWVNARARDSLERVAALEIARAELERVTADIDLLTKLDVVQRSQPGCEFAPYLSLFSQRAWPGVRLKTATVRLSGTDTVVVAADGIARQSAGVLDLKAYLDSCVAPWSFMCERLRPMGVVRTDGMVDTITSFTLKMVQTND